MLLQGPLFNVILCPWLTPVCVLDWMFDRHGIIWGPGARWRIAAIIAVSCMTVLVEYLVIYLLLKRPVRARLRLVVVVLLANAVANPFAQIALGFCLPLDAKGHATTLNRLLGYYFGVAISESILSTVLVVCSLQAVVLVMEFGLLRWLFSSMFRRRELLTPVTTLRTLMITVAAKASTLMLAVLALALAAEVLYVWGTPLAEAL